MRPLSALVVLIMALPGAVSLPAQNDAGSGGDAPDLRHLALPIEPGRVYEGAGHGLFLDQVDWYSFHAVEGQTLHLRSSGMQHCSYLYAPSDEDYVGGSCANTPALEASDVIEVHETGVWSLRFLLLSPEEYQFSVGLDAAAPDPALFPGLALFPSPGDLPIVTSASEDAAHPVIAVVDTGVNPYHEFFRAPELQRHPAQWIQGFDHPVSVVDLTFDAPSVSSALEADENVWDAVERSTILSPNLYWFNGTRVLGISFGEFSGLFTAPGTIPIYDEDGHGTHSAGLAAGAGLPVANGNVIVVMIEADDTESAIVWAARQPWIDAISVSIGTLANAPVPGIEAATAEAALQGKPILIASGNGVSGTGLAPDHCTTYTSAWVGPAWVTRVGAASPATGNPTYWHCLPVEAIARTDVTSPDAGSYRAADVATGTSASTPNLAGHYGTLLQELRQLGVHADRQVALDHLLRAARPAELSADLGAQPSLAATSPLDQGYGLVDRTSVDRARDRVEAGLPPEPRPEMDAFRPTDLAIRTALWGTPEAPGPGGSALAQDDAGSGQDAGEGPAGAVPIEPGVVHDGAFMGLDSEDWYSFPVAAGQTIHLRASSAISCSYLHEPSQQETEVEFGCSTGYLLEETWTYVATESGTWYVSFLGFQLDFYRFGVGVDAPAPPLGGPLDHDDAGSGQDAGDEPAVAVPIEAGVVYEGTLTAVDSADWYSFSAVAGETIDLRASGAFTCSYLFGPSQQETDVASACSTGYVIESAWTYTATESGTWYVKFISVQPDAYSFGIGIGAPAPAPESPLPG